MTDEQFKKLPQYARDEILSLRLSLDSVRSELQAFTSIEPTRIKWGYGFQDEAFGYLRHDETVLFMVGKGRAGIRVKFTQEMDAINLNGDGGLVIELRSGNDCLVRLKS